MISSNNSPAAIPDVDDFSGDDVGTVMDLLADQRRRTLLRYLERVDGTATLSDVAEAIAIEAHNPDPGAMSDLAGVSARGVREVRISLHHHHVPKLAAAGAIDYDPSTETLTLRDRGRTLLDRQEAVCGPLR